MGPIGSALRPTVRSAAGVRLDRDEALGYLGYAGQEMDEELAARFERLARACETSLRPMYAYASFPIDEEATRWDAVDAAEAGDAAADGADGAAGAGEPCVVLAGCGLRLPGKSIAEHVRGAVQVALLACTLGAANERELRKHAALGAADGLMYGAASSALVEAVANVAEASIVADAAEMGLFTNTRFSPGYGDLPLSVQSAFLASLDATRRMGLSVTKGDLLVPTKSVTAVVGLFDDPQAGAGVRLRCGSCQLRDVCMIRTRGRTCHG